MEKIVQQLHVDYPVLDMFADVETTDLMSGGVQEDSNKTPLPRIGEGCL